MKKFLFTLLALSAFLFADVKGFISSIDSVNHTITVNSVVVKVQPYTKIELDGVMYDSVIRFSELKVNDFVDVDCNFYQEQGNSKMFCTAEDIEVERNRSLAY